jgi:hypothetical protein
MVRKKEFTGFDDTRVAPSPVTETVFTDCLRSAVQLLVVSPIVFGYPKRTCSFRNYVVCSALYLELFNIIFVAFETFDIHTRM